MLVSCFSIPEHLRKKCTVCMARYLPGLLRVKYTFEKMSQDPPNINVNDVNDHIYVYDDETPPSVPRNNDERTTAVIEAMSTLNICR